MGFIKINKCYYNYYYHNLRLSNRTQQSQTQNYTVPSAGSGLSPEPKRSGSTYKIEPEIIGFYLTRVVGRTPAL